MPTYELTQEQYDAFVRMLREENPNYGVYVIHIIPLGATSRAYVVADPFAATISREETIRIGKRIEECGVGAQAVIRRVEEGLMIDTEDRALMTMLDRIGVESSDWRPIAAEAQRGRVVDPEVRVDTTDPKEYVLTMEQYQTLRDELSQPGQRWRLEQASEVRTGDSEVIYEFYRIIRQVRDDGGVRDARGGDVGEIRTTATQVEFGRQELTITLTTSDWRLQQRIEQIQGTEQQRQTGRRRETTLSTTHD